MLRERLWQRSVAARSLASKTAADPPGKAARFRRTVALQFNIRTVFCEPVTPSPKAGPLLTRPASDKSSPIAPEPRLNSRFLLASMTSGLRKCEHVVVVAATFGRDVEAEAASSVRRGTASPDATTSAGESVSLIR